MTAQRSIAATLILMACVTATSFAQTPAGELDQNWVNVCPGAIPGSPYYGRCQEIINAGPGSGARRSAAATGNNLETVSAENRAGWQKKEERQVEIKEGRFNFFASGNSGWESHRATVREHAFDATVQSFLMGADYLLAPTVVTSLGMSFETNGVDFQSGVGDLRFRRYSVLNFWNYALPRGLGFDSYVGYKLLRHDVVRNIDYLITLNSGLPTEEIRRINGSARANVRGGQFVSGGDLTLDLAAGALRCVPHLSIDFSSTSLDPYAESDDVGLAMAFDRQRVRSLSAMTGLSASWAMSREWGVLTPQLRLDYLHEYENDERDISSRFVGDANGYRFGVPTDAPDRDFFLVCGGFVAVLPGGFSAFMTFEGALGNRQMGSQTFSTGLRARL